MPSIQRHPIGSDDLALRGLTPAASFDGAASAQARRAAHASHSSGRRRRIDPTTCERDYSAAELEFLLAVEEYKRRSGRPFPTSSEILEVVRRLGYRKPDGPDAESSVTPHHPATFGISAAF